MEQNKSVPAAQNPFGADAVSITVSPKDVAAFKVAHAYATSGIPENLKMKLDTFISEQVSKAATTARAYAENQVYNKLERLVFKLAKQNNIPVREAAAKLGVQLRD